MEADPSRRAGAHVVRQTQRALAANVIAGWATNLALGESLYRRGDSVSDPMCHTRRRPTFRINHEDGKTLSVGWWVGPREGGRDIIADAIRIGLDVPDVFLVEHRAVLER